MVIRKYMPGSEWLYIKIYTGVKLADNILISEIFPLTKFFITQLYIDKWFYIRYSDKAGNHLRLRFHLLMANHISNIITTIYNKLNKYLQSDTIDIISIDTYFREIERYGESTYDTTETLFYYDSSYILEILNNNNDNKLKRWEIGILLTNSILDAFDYTNEKLLAFLSERQDSFRTEFGFDNITSIRLLDKKYRKEKTNIIKILNFGVNNDIMHYINERQNAIKDLYDNTLRQNLYINKDKYTASIIHMTINRLFDSNNRIYELLIYDFLKRYYESLNARIKYHTLIQ